MKKLIFFFAIILGFLVVSCEKESYEITNVNTFDQTAFQAAMDDLRDDILNGLALQLGPVFQALGQLDANDQNQMAALNALAVTLGGNQQALNQLLFFAQQNAANWPTALALLQAIQAQNNQILANQNLQGQQLQDLLAQMVQIQLGIAGLQAGQGQLLAYATQNIAQLNQLITAFGGVQPLLQAILTQTQNNGTAIQNGNLAAATAFATIIANQTNQGQAISQGFASLQTAVTAGNMTDAQVLGIVQQLLPALNQLGVSLDNHAAAILAGINQLNLNDQQTAIALATLIANSNAQAAASQTILNNLIAQGLNQAQMMGMLTGITNQITALQGNIDAWGQTIIAGINNLGLTVAQQGTILGQILANTQNLRATNMLIINKLDQLQFSIDDLHRFFSAEIASVKVEIAVVQTGIAVLQAKSDAIALQILTLSNAQGQGFATIIEMLNDLSSNLCCSSCNNNQPASIITTINNVYNDMSSYIVNHEDNSTNLTFQQIYNAASNGYGCGNAGGVNGANGCQIMAPILVLANNGSQNNASSNNYNWGGMQNNITNYNIANNCP